jgi:exonuclease VII large subunit
VRREIVAARRRLYVSLGTTNRRLIQVSERSQERLASALQRVADRGRILLRAADVGARIPSLQVAIERKRSIATAFRERLLRAVQDKVVVRRTVAREHSRILARTAHDRVHAEKARFSELRTRITLAQPEAIIARGYVIARSVAGQAVTSAREAYAMDVMDIQFDDGDVRVTIHPIPSEGGETHDRTQR